MRNLPFNPGRVCWLSLVVFAAVLLVGCNTRPRAPALRDEPVYQNAQEGFRFLAPEGWVQRARADLPSGTVDKEHLLVSYARKATDKGATLEVSLADLSPSTDLVAYLAGRSFGAEKWRAKAPAEKLEIHGAPAVRLAFTGRSSRDEFTKEVVAFWRGGRVYFFTGIFPSNDTKARDEVRRAVSSVQWKN